MSKKPRKIEESAASYTAKKPAKAEPGIKYADPAQARKSMEKVFRVHHELLRKLAQ